MSELVVNRNPRLPDIKVYNCHNEPGTERKQDDRDRSRSGFLPPETRFVSSRLNLMEKSLLAPVSGSRLSGRRTQTGTEHLSSKLKTTGSSKERSRSTSEDTEGFLPTVFEPKSYTYPRHANSEPDKATRQLDRLARQSKVEAALEMVRRVRELKRENQSLGVPKDFTFNESGCIIIEEDDPRKWRKWRRTKGQREMENAKLVREKTKAKAKNSTSFSCMMLPRRPNLARQKRTISEIGVKWNISPPPEVVAVEANKKLKPWQRWAGAKPPDAQRSGRGMLCKAKYPLAEALTREGTSTEKRRGKTLQLGDWKIMKIWPREANRIQPNILPIQMANEDIPLLRKLYEMAKQYEDPLDARSVENDDNSPSESYNKDEEESSSADKLSDSNANSVISSYENDAEQHDDTERSQDNGHEDADCRETNDDIIECTVQGAAPKLNEQHTNGSKQTSAKREHTGFGCDATQSWVQITNDSQVVSIGDEKAKVQRSWLHQASNVLVAEPGGS